MAITTYTAYSDVRAVLGVTDNELTDATLGLSVYDLNLRAELRAIGSNLPTLFATVDAKSEGDRTEAESVFWETTKLFAAYAVAKQLGSSLPMFSPKQMTDGKSAMERFSPNPYQETLNRIDRMFSRYLNSLTTAYGTVNTSGTDAQLRLYALAVGQVSDRVTSG